MDMLQSLHDEELWASGLWWFVFGRSHFGSAAARGNAELEKGKRLWTGRTKM